MQVNGRNAAYRKTTVPLSHDKLSSVAFFNLPKDKTTADVRTYLREFEYFRREWVD